MLEMTRTIKSDEEIALLEKASALGDKMLQACREPRASGVRESEVYGRMMEAMLADGGEEPTLFLWACDRHPVSASVPACRRPGRWSRGDLIICEIHPKIGGYFTHVERTFCLGEPDKELQRIYDGCVAAFRRGMELFGPGKSIVAAMDEVKRVIDDAGLGICETGIHGHGLASLEYPDTDSMR